MSVVISTERYHPLHEILTRVAQKRVTNLGTTKIAQARGSAEFHGWLDGVAVGLAAFATETRLDALRQVGYAEQFATAVASYEVHGWLRSVKDRWDNGFWESVSDEEFFDRMAEEFARLVFDDSTKDTIHRVRKQAILAGTLDPTEADVEWLQEEGSSFKSLSEPYERALSKLTHTVPTPTTPPQDDVLYPDEV